MKSCLWYLRIIIFFVSTGCAYAAQGETKPIPFEALSTQERDGKYYAYKDDKLYTGSAFTIEDTPRGKIRRELPFVDGQFEGIEQRYYENGQLAMETHWKGSYREGSQTSYFPSGRQETDEHYVRGDPDGTNKAWYEDGTLREEVTIVNGKIEGMRTSYHKNGKVKEIIPFHDGNIEGVVKVYDENGMLDSETPFVANREQGEKISYYPNGASVRTAYDRGIPGGSRFYDENGKEIESPFKRKR